MGGIIALTIRISATQQYRGSCHTNVLPVGLWAAPFYVDLDTSKAHTWTWLQAILENRRQDPALEEIWGGHDMLAPLGYGIVVIDYVTNTFISAQGYSDPAIAFRWGHDSLHVDKWDALNEAGLLEEDPALALYGADARARRIKMPFATVGRGGMDAIDDNMQKWAEDNFGLSDQEKAEWQAFMHEYDE